MSRARAPYSPRRVIPRTVGIEAYDRDLVGNFGVTGATLVHTPCDMVALQRVS